jgi:Tn3 transposase DDE domain
VNAACNKPARKPDAGNPPVRFDEGEGSFIGPSLLYSSRSNAAARPNLYQILLGALIAHGTNLGLVGMAHSVEGMTVDVLQYVSQMFLTETTLKAANAP